MNDIKQLIEAAKREEKESHLCLKMAAALYQDAVNITTDDMVRRHCLSCAKRCNNS